MSCKWINVKNRLPRDRNPILCRINTPRYADLFIGWYDAETELFWDEYGDAEYADVTHWCPLPEGE